MTFQERMRALLNKEGTGMNITPEQREKLLAAASAVNTDVYEGIGTSVSAVTVAQAVAAAQTLTQQTNTDIFADQIQLATNSGLISIPCAASKASNIATSDIKDATVWKLMCQLSVNQVAGQHANAAVKNDHLMPFAEKEAKGSGAIVKKCSVKDMFMSGTVFPQDITNAKQLNSYFDLQHRYKLGMMSEFLSEMSKLDLTDDAKITVYRCASRALADTIFDQVWREHFPLYDGTDAGEVADYVEAKKAYHGALNTIGNQYMSSASVTCGMLIRKMSIAPNPKWSSANKLGHVKKFGPGKSFYVASTIESGLMTIPVTTSMLQKHINNLVILTHAGCAMIEKEVLAENGYSTNHVTIPDITNIKPNEALLGKPYYEILGIQQAEENNIYARLKEAFIEKAENVVKAVNNRNNTDNAAALEALLGTK